MRTGGGGIVKYYHPLSPMLQISKDMVKNYMMKQNSATIRPKPFMYAKIVEPNEKIHEVCSNICFGIKDSLMKIFIHHIFVRNVGKYVLITAFCELICD